METIPVDRELAQEFAWSFKGANIDGFTVVHNERVGSRRWVSVHELVIQKTGTDEFYETSYERGLTESQDQAPFEYDGDVIQFHRVYPHEVTTIEYRDFPPGGKK